MEEIIIDARGLSCPEPVLRTKKAFDSHSSFTTLVDNEVAKENVMRFCTNKKATINIENEKNEWKIKVSK